MSCREAGLDFNIAATAGWYSAIAGLLAGFALLAILLPLDHAAAADDDEATSATADAEVVFTCAFFSLLVLAVSYAVLAGRTAEGPDAGIAAAEQLLIVAAFGLSSLLLLLGLHAILGSYGTNRLIFLPARGVAIAMTSIAGPAILLAQQFSSALDLQHNRAETTDSATCGWGGLPSGVWVNLAIVSAALAGVVVLAVVRERLPHVSDAAALIAKVVLGVTVLVAVGTSVVVPLLPASTVTGAMFEHVALAVSATATVALAAASWLGR